ncbi:MAG: tetratricopeptide repeat protein [Verrucomicrobia bacterium]|nr:tetratricopeptide repeat protein [Verrucomicrobiota bacterium]
MKCLGLIALVVMSLPATGPLCAFAADSPALRDAIACFNRHDFAKAKLQFHRLLAAESTNAEARLYLGRIALEEDQLGEGIDHLDQATRLNVTNAVYFLWLARGYGLQARKAGIPTGIGPALKSRAAFEKSVALDPDLIEAREDLIQFHREAPGIVGGSRRAARAHANEIQKRDAYIGALVQGDLLMDDRKYREAENVYRSAVGTKPVKVDAYYRQGLLHLKLKEFEKAFSAFERILRMDTNEVEACFHIGETGALSGQRLERAEEALKIYLRTKPWSIMPTLADAHFRLGQVYERQGKHELARAEFQAALKLEPSHREARAALRKLR